MDNHARLKLSSFAARTDYNNMSLQPTSVCAIIALPTIDNNRGRENGVRAMRFAVSDIIIIYYCKTVAAGWKFSSYLICLAARTSHRWRRWNAAWVYTVLRSFCADDCVRLSYARDLCRKYIMYLPSLVRNLTNARAR